MPFIQVDIKQAIRDKCTADPEFREAWDESREKYQILGELTALRNQELSPSAISSRSNSDDPNEVIYSAMESAEKGKDMDGPFSFVSELMNDLNN